MKVKVTQSCPTLCNAMDYILHGILQARILPFTSGSSQPRDWTQVFCIKVDSSPAESSGEPTTYLLLYTLFLLLHQLHSDHGALDPGGENPWLKESQACGLSPLPGKQPASSLKRNDYRAALHMLHLIFSMSFLNSVGHFSKS